MSVCGFPPTDYRKVATGASFRRLMQRVEQRVFQARPRGFGSLSRYQEMYELLRVEIASEPQSKYCTVLVKVQLKR